MIFWYEIKEYYPTLKTISLIIKGRQEGNIWLNYTGTKKFINKCYRKGNLFKYEFIANYKISEDPE